MDPRWIRNLVLFLFLAGFALGLGGCNPLKSTLLSQNGTPLSSFAILVTSPNIISVPEGKTVTVSASLSGKLFSDVDYSKVTIVSSDPGVATVSLKKSTEPYLFGFNAISAGKTFITVRFDNNSNTDLTIEAMVYAISNVTNLKGESGDGTVNLTWSVPSENRAAQIRIYRNTSPTFSESNRIDDGKATLKTTAFVDSKLTNGTTYYYKIALADSEGFTSSGTTISVTPKSNASDSSTGAISSSSPLNSIPDNTSNSSSSANISPSQDSKPSQNATTQTNPAPTAVEITDLFVVGTSNVKIAWTAPVDTDLKTIRIFQNDQSIISFAPTDFTSGSYNYLTPPLEPGTYSYSVAVSDGTNPEVKSTVRTIEVTARTSVQPVQILPTPNLTQVEVTDHNRVHLKWSIDKSTSITTYFVIQDGVTIATLNATQNLYDYEYTTPILADGTYRFSIRASTNSQSAESSSVLAIVDDRPVITQFSASTLPENSQPTTLVVDGTTYSNLLPDNAIFNWSASGSSHGIREIELYENDSLVSTLTANATGFVSAPLSVGIHHFRLIATDETGKSATPVLQDLEINYLRPISNLSRSTDWGSVSSGLNVRLNWTLPAGISISDVEIRRSSNPNNDNPYSPAVGTRQTTLLSPTETQYSTTVFGPTYFDVRLKQGTKYSLIKKEIAVFPSTWDSLSSPEKINWDNSANQDSGSQALLNTLYIDSSITPSDVSATGAIDHLDISVPGVDLHKLEFVVITGTGIRDIYRDLITSQNIKDDATIQFLNNSQTIRIPSTYIPDIRIGSAAIVTLAYRNPDVVAHQLVVNPTLSTDLIDPRIMDGQNWTESGQKKMTIKIQNRLAEIKLANGEVIVGTVEFTDPLTGNIRVVDASGSTKGLYPFKVYVDDNHRQYIQLSVQNSLRVNDGKPHFLKFIVNF